MFIAYTTLDAERRNPESIVIAVCVFVQPGGFYTTMGVTKSGKYKNAYRGSAVQLQQYVARVVQTKVDPRTIGLLFRPNALMRKIMLKVFGAAVVGGHTKSGLIGGFVGSNWDIWWTQHMRRPPLDFDTVRDEDPSIIQSRAGIQIRRLFIDAKDHQYRAYPACCAFDSMRHPFWEPPAHNPNPDSPNNPQLPLVFFPIKTLRCNVEGAYHCE